MAKQHVAPQEKAEKIVKVVRGIRIGRCPECQSTHPQTQDLGLVEDEHGQFERVQCGACKKRVAKTRWQATQPISLDTPNPERMREPRWLGLQDMGNGLWRVLSGDKDAKGNWVVVSEDSKDGAVLRASLEALKAVEGA